MDNRPSAKEKPLTVTDVAKELGYSEKTIRDILNRGELRGTRLRPGGKWLVTREALDSYKEKRGLGPKFENPKTIPKFTKDIDQPTNSSTSDSKTEMGQLSRQHDIAIFQKFENIQNEGQLLSFLSYLDYGYHIWDACAVETLCSFCELSKRESNKYLNLQVQKDSENFITTLGELIFFISRESTNFPDPSDTRLLLHPELRQPHLPQYEIPRNKWRESNKLYDQYEERLFELTNKVRISYSKFRASIRTSLFI